MLDQDHLGGTGGGGLADINNASFLDQIPLESGGVGVEGQTDEALRRRGKISLQPECRG